jgi:uncharacterized membrane protein YqiK
MRAWWRGIHLAGLPDYEFLSLTPISINVDLRNALSKQNIRIDVPSRFTVGISTEPGVMQNAAERLLGLKQDEVEALAMDIIFGQLRLVVATMDIEEINTDRDKFLDAVSRNVETELKKIGLRLINVNVTDIKDESGYIEALGKEAAAKAINDAKKSVAEKNRDGAIGEAEAKMDERIRVTKANATAIEGENTAKVTVANSDATGVKGKPTRTAAQRLRKRWLSPWRSNRPTTPRKALKGHVPAGKWPPPKPMRLCRPKSTSAKWRLMPRPAPSRFAGSAR